MHSFYQRQRSQVAADAPKVIELFAGGGGWAAGFEMAGFRSSFAVEFDPTNPKLSGKLADCHEVNFPHCKVIRRTVQDCDRLNWAGFPRNQILVASPVCANFSEAKHGASEEQVDIDCAIAVAGAIAKLTPKIFVLEQVPRYEHSRSWQLIKEQLEIEGYKISTAIVNMRDWGIPQLARKRKIVVASKNFKFKFPSPQGENTCWWEAIKDLDSQPSELLQKQKDAIAKYTGDRTIPLLIQRTGNRGDCKIYEAGHPAPTLTKSIFCDHKGDSRSRFFDILLPDGTVKKLSLRAAARIQGFPDWWQPTCGAAIGYAVPPYFSYQLFLTNSP